MLATKKYASGTLKAKSRLIVRCQYLFLSQPAYRNQRLSGVQSYQSARGKCFWHGQVGGGAGYLRLKRFRVELMGNAERKILGKEIIIERDCRL